MRPLGQSAGNVFESQSNGHAVRNGLSLSLSANGKKFSFYSQYALGKSKSADDGTSGSSFDPYDFSNEWGRSTYDVRHSFYANGNYQAPHGFSIFSFVTALLNVVSSLMLCTRLSWPPVHTRTRK